MLRHHLLYARELPSISIGIILSLSLALFRSLSLYLSFPFCQERSKINILKNKLSSHLESNGDLKISLAKSKTKQF